MFTILDELHRCLKTSNTNIQLSNHFPVSPTVADGALKMTKVRIHIEVHDDPLERAASLLLFAVFSTTFWLVTSLYEPPSISVFIQNKVSVLLHL